jgi:hypothetical protein
LRAHHHKSRTGGAISPHCGPMELPHSNVCIAFNGKWKGQAVLIVQSKEIFGEWKRKGCYRIARVALALSSYMVYVLSAPVGYTLLHHHQNVPTGYRYPMIALNPIKMVDGVELSTVGIYACKHVLLATTMCARICLSQCKLLITRQTGADH